MTIIKAVTLPKDDRGNDPNDFRDDTGYIAKFKEKDGVEGRAGASVIDKLRSLSATHRVDEMERNLKNNFYIVDEMALDGQITLFYAKPGTGKTLFFLWFIIKGIKSGRIKPANVFYVNADDHYKGLLTKSRIARERGFHMISPAEAGVSPKEILSLLDELSKSDDAAGKIIFLDTLKKFADMMSKKSQAELYETLRRLVARNASVIIAGHANKHLDIDGNLVYEGTSDTLNDIDCMYAIYRMTARHVEDVVVEFRNEKDRGDVVNRVSYGFRHAEGANYYDMLDSVSKLDGAQVAAFQRQSTEEALKAKYESEILFVTELLEKDALIQAKIVEKFGEAKGAGIAGEISKKSLLDSLDKLTGITWNYERLRDGNAKLYSLIGANARRYHGAKWGD